MRWFDTVRPTMVLLLFILLVGGAAALPAQTSSFAASSYVDTEHPVALQDGMSGPIPMNMTVIVGDAGNAYEDALAYASAIPLALVSNATHTAAGMLLPDAAADMASPLDDWLGLSNGYINDLVYVGDIYGAEHLALVAASHETHSFTGSNIYEIAADLARGMFPASPSVVVCYADPSDAIFETTSLVDTSGSLSPPSTSSISGHTDDANYWEYRGEVPVSAGGVIAELTDHDESLFFDMLARRGNEYYLMDTPWLDAYTVAHPYEEVSGETWVLHVIDMYEYQRDVSFSFAIKYPDADVYSVEVSPGEDCRLDIYAQPAGSARLGVHVLGPDGRMVANGNRYSFLEASDLVTEVTVSLSHPRPGTYRVYVTNGGTLPVSYNLDVTKSVVRPGWDATAASVSNGAAVASLLGAPILYVNEANIPAETQALLDSWSGENVYVVDPMNAISQSVIGYLTGLQKEVSILDDFKAVQQFLADFGQFDATSGSVILYDNLGTSFVAAALSAAQRQAVALPFSHGGSPVMTTAQVAEQVSWHREYQFSLSSGISILDLWSDDPDLTKINPPYSDMHAICDAFFPWLETNTGITDPGLVIDFSPFYGIGMTMPMAFERAILGKAMPGRYASTSTEATLVQVMRSVLRIPLLSSAGASRDVLASYVAYAYGLDVPVDSIWSVNVNNRDEISTMVSQVGLNTVFSAGLGVPSSLTASPYLWAFSTHGIAGDLMYKDDGFVALMSTNTAAGYESYGNADSDGDGIVNPSSSYIDAHEMGDLLAGVNLRGTMAIVDSCQIASSYAPASLMEAGADAVVACWTDSLFGPSDLVERNILRELSYSDASLGIALLGALTTSSHVYSLDDMGLDYYIGTTEVLLIGASSEQFVLFGDPLVTLVDWQVAGYQMMSRFQSLDYLSVLRAHPGSTCRLPLGQFDTVGHIFAAAGTYSIEVLNPSDAVLSSGVVVATESAISYYEIVLPTGAELGEYTVLCTDTTTDEEYVVTLIVEPPILAVVSVAVESASQIGTWQVMVSVMNPHDAATDALMTIQLGTTPIHVQSTTWDPGTRTQTFTVDVLLVAAGSQSLTVTLAVDYLTPLSFSGGTVVVVSTTFAYYGLFLSPLLAFAAAAISYLSSRQLKSLRRLQLARGSELDGDLDDAFESYSSLGLEKSSIRVAARSGFEGETVQLLTARLGDYKVRAGITEAAAQFEAKGDYLPAARLYEYLGFADSRLRNALKADLGRGMYENVEKHLAEMIQGCHWELASDMLVLVSERLEPNQLGGLVTRMHESLEALISQAHRNPERTKTWVTIARAMADKEAGLRFLVAGDLIQEAAVLIVDEPSLDKMSWLTNMVAERSRAAVACAVVALLRGRSPVEAAKYLGTVDLNERSLSLAAEPLTRDLFASPSNEQLAAELQNISKWSASGSVRSIDLALDTASRMVTGRAAASAAVADLQPMETLRGLAAVADDATFSQLLMTACDAVPLTRVQYLTVPEVARLTGSLRWLAANVQGTRKNRVDMVLQRYQQMLRPMMLTAFRASLSRCPPANLSDTIAMKACISAALQGAVVLEDPVLVLMALVEVAKQRGFSELVELAVKVADHNEVQAKITALTIDRALMQLLASRHSRWAPDSAGRMVRQVDLEAVKAEVVRMALAESVDRLGRIWEAAAMDMAQDLLLRTVSQDVDEETRVAMAVNYVRALPRGLDSSSMMEFLNSLAENPAITEPVLARIMREASVPSSIADQVQARHR